VRARPRGALESFEACVDVRIRLMGDFSTLSGRELGDLLLVGFGGFRRSVNTDAVDARVSPRGGGFGFNPRCVLLLGGAFLLMGERDRSGTVSCGGVSLCIYRSNKIV